MPDLVFLISRVGVNHTYISSFLLFIKYLLHGNYIPSCEYHNEWDQKMKTSAFTEPTFGEGQGGEVGLAAETTKQMSKMYYSQKMRR